MSTTPSALPRQNNSITVDGAIDNTAPAAVPPKHPLTLENPAIIKNPLNAPDAAHDKMEIDPKDDPGYLKQHLQRAEAEIPEIFNGLRVRVASALKDPVDETFGQELERNVKDEWSKARQDPNFVMGMVGPGELGDSVPAMKQMVEGNGLVYKGEVTPGSGVHQIEHPGHPGMTATVKDADMASPESISQKMASKLEEFKAGIEKSIENLKKSKPGGTEFPKSKEPMPPNPEPAPINPQEAVDLTKEKGRTISPEEVLKIRRQDSTDANVSAGLQGKRGDEASTIREQHRAALEKGTKGLSTRKE